MSVQTPLSGRLFKALAGLCLWLRVCKVDWLLQAPLTILPGIFEFSIWNQPKASQYHGQ